MQIKLNNFKCYKEATFNFPDHGLVLLNGESGAGKTTLITALLFVLYGNVRKVANFMYPGTKTSVELDVPRLKINIHRQKKPDLLRVVFDGRETEDAEAQSIIDRVFGNEVLFQNGSYVRQKKGCALLEGTNAERMDHISHFAFEQDTSLTPAQFRDALQKHLTAKEKELSVESALWSSCLEEVKDAEAKTEGTEPPPTADELIEKKEVEARDLEVHVVEHKALEQKINTLSENRASLNSLETIQQQIMDRLVVLKESLVEDVPAQQLVEAQQQEATTAKCAHAMQSFIELNEEYKKLEASVSHVEKPGKSLRDAEVNVANTTVELREAQIKLKTLSNEFIQSGEANAKLSNLKSNIEATKQEIVEEQDTVDSSTATDSDIARTAATIDRLQELVNQHQNFQLNQERKGKIMQQMVPLEACKTKNLVALQLQVELCTTLQTRGVDRSVEKLDDVFQKLWARYYESRGERLCCPHCSHDVLLRDNELFICKHKPNPYKKPTKPISVGNINTKTDWVKAFRSLDERDLENEGFEGALKTLKAWLDGTRDLIVKRDFTLDLDTLTETITNIKTYQELVGKLEGLPKVDQPKELLVDLKRNLKVNTQQLDDYRMQKAACDASKKRLMSLKGRLAALEREAAQLASHRHPNVVKQEISETQNLVNKHQAKIDENSKLVDFWNKYNTFISQQRVLNDVKAKTQHYISVLKEHGRDSWRVKDLQEAHENAKEHLTRLTIQHEQAVATHREYDAATQQLESVRAQAATIDFDDDVYQKLKTEFIVKSAAVKLARETLEHTSSLFNLRTLYDELESRRAAAQAKEIIINRCNSELASLVKLKEICTKAESHVLLETIQNINRIMDAELKGLFDSEIKVTLETTKQLKTKDARRYQLNCNINYKGFNYDDISSLSGGEGDRVSLAMVCALNRISGSRILILDETISSMDSELKLDVLDALRALGNSRLILVVNHEGVLGAFDEIIDVNA